MSKALLENFKDKGDISPVVIVDGLDSELPVCPNVLMLECDDSVEVSCDGLDGTPL